MRTRSGLITAVLVATLALAGCGSDDSDDATAPEPTEETTPTPEPEPTEDAPGLAEQVEAAFSASYGWPDDPAWTNLVAFDDRDAPRVTVVTDFADKPENEADAMGYCRAVASVSSSVEERFTGVYVTAGEGGPFIAECKTGA